ncbi:MAG: SpoIIE family protein phosphatase [Clostridia bacterium]
MNDLWIDIHSQSLNKYTEELCGDHVELVKKDDNSQILVLADGMGSGVKANILSTLTSKIISTMMAQDMEIEECVATIASTLPVCAVRQVAYSTFTIIKITDNKTVEIFQYDNPHVIMLRNGEFLEFEKEALEMDGKTIYKSKLEIQENDVFIATSDGAIHAGVGQSLNFGWDRPQIIDFMTAIYDETFTAKMLAELLLGECNRLYGFRPGDDTTVCAVKVIKRNRVNLLIGPPVSPADVERMLTEFFSKEGKYIVCGGTTSTLVGEFLKKPVLANLDYLDPDIPPTADIEGVDICTEGVITMSRVMEYCKDYIGENEKYSDWIYKKDGASLIAKMLLEEATDIHFFVGMAINPAHQNPSLPINFNIKMNLIKEVSETLSAMGKTVTRSYF